MKVIGVSGYARSGKDAFCNIAIDILGKNGICAKQYSFAEKVKEDVNPFLSKMCGISAWTQVPEEKKSIRDFFVWYATTFWRTRDPKHWIRGVDTQLKADGNDVDIALISDVRYTNECEWVHSWSGYVVHIESWKKSSEFEKIYLDAPNAEESKNDPLVKLQSDYKLEWEAKGLSLKEAVEHPELRMEVRKALNACSWFTDALIL